MAVLIEIGCDTAVPAHRDVDSGIRAHVLEATTDVAVEPAPWQAALRLRGDDVDVRMRVDDEEVEPAVTVVVEPAQSSAHHRCRIQRHPESERSVAEVEPNLLGHVDERRAAQLPGRYRRP